MEAVFLHIRHLVFPLQHPYWNLHSSPSLPSQQAHPPQSSNLHVLPFAIPAIALLWVCGAAPKTLQIMGTPLQERQFTAAFACAPS